MEITSLISTELKDIFRNVNDWLKFAESKNAILLAADSAAIFGLLRLLQKGFISTSFLKLYICFMIFLFVLAALICLLSFVPQIKIPWLLSIGKKQSIDNLVFYGDIAKYDPQEFLIEFYTRIENPTQEVTKLDRDYAAQIVVNSRIAASKFKYFNVAIWLTIAALITPVFAFILFLKREKD